MNTEYDQNGYVKRFNVAGTSFRKNTVHECFSKLVATTSEEYVVVELKPEPENKYDANAVAVYITLGGDDSPYHVGYVPKDVNQRLKPNAKYKLAYIGDAVGTGNIGIIIERDME
jgi:hypothetical protein